MLTILYSLCAFLLAVQLVVALRFRPVRQDRAYVWILLVVLIGLTYDNLIIAVGALIGPGDLLKALNAGRYVGHAIGTPLLTIFAFGVARRAELDWAQGKAGHLAACLFTTVLIAIGVYNDIIRLDLALRPLQDVLRYSNVGIKGPPIPSVTTILALIFIGAALWRATGWRWFALGATLMFIAAAVGMGDRIFISNIGEVVLGVASVSTAKRFLRSAQA